LFESLTNKLQDVFRKLTGKGKLSLEDVDSALKDIRVALLAADVHFSVVKALSERIREKAVGQEIMTSLTPGQQVIKIVRDELTEILGKNPVPLEIKRFPVSIMLVGLQGSGKTTTCVKLAKLFKDQGKHVLLVGLDEKRPAAMEQLSQLASKASIDCFIGSGNTLELTRKALSYFREKNYDLAILDTAGRLHVDEDLMEELKTVKEIFQPSETILVLDSTLGHVALQVGIEFQKIVGFDSLILTKLDGDAKGGAALSAHYVTGKPLKFITQGEKLADLEPFYPDRMASLILGMGDTLSLIEKAERVLSEKEKAEMERQVKEGLTLDIFLQQMEKIQEMGDVGALLPRFPGLNFKEVDSSSLHTFKAIIQSMTKEEREYPAIINSSRKKRIAVGSGTSVQEVNILLKRFEQFKNLLRQANKGKIPFLKNFPQGG